MDRGPFKAHEGRSLNEFLDGTSHTIAGSELRAGRTDADRRGAWYLPWMGRSIYLHKNTPNSSAADAFQLHACIPVPPPPRKPRKSHLARRSVTMPVSMLRPAAGILVELTLCLWTGTSGSIPIRLT